MQPMSEPVTELPAACASAPVSRVAWLHRDRLNPNNWNPNHVFRPELELLVLSILEDGFTQPIVILPDMTIVDGYHRWRVSDDERIRQRYAGFVPTVTIDVDPVHRRMSTVRHNRARGQHGVLPMAQMVRAMVDEGVPTQDIMRRLGMEREEIMRLVDRAGMPERGARGSGGFGKEWVPTKDAAPQVDNPVD
jgi:ParB-like chromosome segregation protein Spo0J